MVLGTIGGERFRNSASNVFLLGNQLITKCFSSCRFSFTCRKRGWTKQFYSVRCRNSFPVEIQNFDNERFQRSALWLNSVLSLRLCVAFRIIWHTSELIIWRTSCESEVRMCGAGPLLPET